MKVFIKLLLLVMASLSFSLSFAALEINEIGIHIRNSSSVPIQCTLGNSGKHIHIDAQSTKTTYFDRDGGIGCKPIDPYGDRNESIAKLKVQMLSEVQLQQRSENSYVYPAVSSQ